ncbi:MAG: DUF3450 domain-containing protein [Myxococcales bacterium]|nr:DUF3450 domain-containing protein [Myxococcales bacterium]
MGKLVRSLATVLGLAALASIYMAPAHALAQGKARKKSKSGKPRVEKVVKRVKQVHKDAAGAQKQVDTLNNEALDLTAQYRNVQRRMDSLKVYNGQLNDLIDAQEAKVSEIRAEIDEVSVVGRQVLPLMHRMVDSLAKFVELDVPFLLEERRKRVQLLRETMARADVSNAEKYRRVVEAYQIENEYGRTIEAYKESVKIGGKEKPVEFLRIGRVSLIYKTLDGQEFGVWDTKKKAYMPMDSGYERDILAGLRIAREQEAPNIIRVPVPAPVAAKEAK